MAKLVFVNGDQAGKGITLVPGREVVLGRVPECDIVVDSVPGISRRHAVFKAFGDTWKVEDAGSQNGMYYDGQKVEKLTLQDQDVVWFSNLAIRFEAKGEVAKDDTAVRIRPPASSGAPVDGEETVNVARDRLPVGSASSGTAKSAAAPAAGTSPGAPPPSLPPSIQRGLNAPAPVPAVVHAPAQAPAPVKEAPSAYAPAPIVVATHPAAPAGPALVLDLDHIAEVGKARDRIIAEFGKVIVGQRDVLDELMVALLSSGHCLMIGLPGLAKTLMISTLSQILDLQFKRIQFTPDLMPSDIIGSDVLDMDSENGRKSFRFIHGPIFTNMLLADEINRTPPKTQAALLEAMQERQVTASNHRFPLPAPFFVLATQNPLEQEGTYPLPEAQLDRFMFNIMVDYPAEEEEERIVMETTRRRKVDVQKVLTGEELLRLQNMVRDLPVSPHVVKYATRLVRATRPGDKQAPDYIRANVSCGAGPRAAQFLALGAKARAVLDGRLNVSCDDVRALAMPILRHRIFTNFTADSEGIKADDLVKRLLLNVPEPRSDEY